MIVVLTTEWYTYRRPAGWPPGDPVPEEWREVHLRGRAISTVCFDPDAGEAAKPRLKGCGVYLTSLAVAQRYDREGLTPMLDTGELKIHATYAARLWQPGQPVNRAGGEDL
jgi:hypothetical protein